MMSFLPEDPTSWLLEAAARAIVMAALVGLGLKLARAHNPHTQLAAWRCVLVAALVMPLLMPLMVWEVLPGPVVSAPLTLALGETTIENPSFGFAGALQLCGQALCDAADDLFEGAAVGTKAAAFDWHQVLLPLYGAVAALLLARLALGMILTLRLRAGAVPLRADWTAGRDIRVSARLPAPVTVGATILLPAEHWSWPAEKRAAVLAHESAHAARGDYHVQLLAGVHRALFWFSPLAWWLHDKLADLAELASDAEAATVVAQRSSYAAILLEFAGRPRLRGIAAVGMARRETVARRIERILEAHALPVRLPLGATRLISVAVAVLAMASAATLAQGPAVQSPLPPVVPMAPPAPTLLVPQLPNPTPLPEVRIYEDLDETTRAAVRALREEERRIEMQRRAVERTNERNSERNTDRTVERVVERAVAKAAERAAEISERMQERAQRALEKEAKLEAKLQAKVDARLERAALQTGPRTKETRTVPAFTSVSLAAVFGTLKITVGDAPSLVLEGDAATLSQVRSEVRHGTLIIDHDNNGPQRDNWRGLGGVTAIVTLPRLKNVSLSGVGRVQVDGLNGGETEFEMSGSGLIEASGKLDKLELKISGAGKANLPELVVGDAEIRISGSGDATVQPVERLSVDISGSARVHYVGQPQSIRTSISGWGTVHSR